MDENCMVFELKCTLFAPISNGLESSKKLEGKESYEAPFPMNHCLERHQRIGGQMETDLCLGAFYEEGTQFLQKIQMAVLVLWNMPCLLVVARNLGHYLNRLFTDHEPISFL
jgi:hypothetical protein